MSRATWDVPRASRDFAYRPVTFFGAVFHRLPLSVEDPTSGSRYPIRQAGWFGLFPFRSPLLRESLLFSFPPGTEMFHFPGLATKPYGFRLRQRGIIPAGFSHSEISGSKRICRYPKLIAAYHVLHRLLMPRHPSCALLSLTKIEINHGHS